MHVWGSAEQPSLSVYSGCDDASVRGMREEERLQHIHMFQHLKLSSKLTHITQPENGHTGLDDPLAATQCEGANLGSDVRVKIYIHTHTYACACTHIQGRGLYCVTHWSTTEISVPTQTYCNIMSLNNKRPDMKLLCCVVVQTLKNHVTIQD